MPTMNAFVINSFQAPEVVPARVPVPQIGAEELLIRVAAVGVGIHDSTFLPNHPSFPFPIGIEAAGVIEQAGPAATTHRVGDRVAFVSMMQPKGGVWAEYAAVHKDSLILAIPDGMSFEQAAAVPVAGNTILRAYHALPAMPVGGRLFIAGASGAIGTFAIQLACKRGWQVAASASPQNHDYLRELGASLAVDYQKPQWPEEILQHYPGGVDSALAIQPSTTAPSMGVVRDGGSVITVSGDQVAPSRGIRVAGLDHGADVRAELEELMNDIVAGTVKLVIEQRYPFAEARAALAKVQTRHARGKIVLTLQD